MTALFRYQPPVPGLPGATWELRRFEGDFEIEFIQDGPGVDYLVGFTDKEIHYCTSCHFLLPAEVAVKIATAILEAAIDRVTDEH